MIKPRSAIARIGVGLAIVAGLSMGAPAASFAQEEFDTSQVSSISQSADAGIATCKNNEDRDFAFQCSGTSATGYRQKEDHLQSTFGSKAIQESRYVCTWTVPMTIEERAI